MNDGNFLGAGMKFPPQVNRASGRFALSSGKESVRESVYLILMTQKTERWLRPGFGSSLLSYTFMDTGDTMLHMMAREIRGDLMQGEPRISEVDIHIGPEVKKGCLIVEIRYTVTSMNTRDNLVFPFYLNAVQEGAEDAYESF